MQYTYTVATKQGTLQRGTREGSSVREVTAALRAQGLYVLEVRPVAPRRRLRTVLRGTTARASLVERALLARHLALMLNAGLTVDRALDILANQTSRKGLQTVLRTVREDIRRGDALSVACTRFPRVFSPLFISVLRWGEAGGALAESLQRLAVQLDRDVALRSAVRGAMIYPAIVVGATVLLGILLSSFVLPRLLTVFQSFDLQLPLITRIFLAVAGVIASRGLLLFLGLVALLVVLFLLARLAAVRPFIHTVVLRMPVMGRLVRDVNLARLERILGSLVRSGLPILEALSVTGDALTNVSFRRALQAVAAQAQRGMPMAGTLAKFPRLFPPIVSQMVAVGEETGKLEEVLLYLADFTEEEVTRTTKNLATIIEPILLVGVGLVVGGVALAIITPIYQFTGSLTR